MFDAIKEENLELEEQKKQLARDLVDQDYELDQECDKYDEVRDILDDYIDDNRELEDENYKLQEKIFDLKHELEKSQEECEGLKAQVQNLILENNEQKS